MENATYGIIASILTIGLVVCTQVITGFNLFCEYSPSKYHSYMGTSWNMQEGSEFIWLTLFYWFVNKNTFYPLYLSLALQVVLIVIIYCFLPESPKWLYEMKKYRECYEVLKKLGKFNGVTQQPLAT